MLLEILLHHDLGADRAQIAAERIAAGPELIGDGGEENFHVTPFIMHLVIMARTN